jgi:hypothetical protein
MLTNTLAGFGFFSLKPLCPVIKISYLRFRFREALTGQSLALDCQIHSDMVMPGQGHGQSELGISGAVIEIKGQDLEMPASLRGLKLLDLDWGQFSKYAACMNAHMGIPMSEGNVSPSGRDVAGAPVMLRPGKAVEADWDRFFGSPLA